MFDPIYAQEDIATVIKYERLFRDGEYDHLGTYDEDTQLVYINEEFFDAVDALLAAHTLHLNQVTTSPLLKSNVIDYDSKLSQFLDFKQGNLEANYVKVAEEKDHRLHYRLCQDVLNTDRWNSGIIANSNAHHFYSEARYNRSVDKTVEILEEFYFGRSVSDQLNHMVQRINALTILLSYRTIDTNFAKYMNNKSDYTTYVGRMLDNYNWSQCISVRSYEDTKATEIKVKDPGLTERLDLDITREDLMTLFENTNISLKHSELLMNGRKTLIQAVEEVPVDEINKAAKKMKFNGDLSSVRCYKITSGIKVKNSRIFNDYWFMKRCDSIRIEEQLEDISGNYIVVSENDTSKFQSITTSIGRSLSSVNRQVTNKVMDSLDLSF